MLNFWFCVIMTLILCDQNFFPMSSNFFTTLFYCKEHKSLILVYKTRQKIHKTLEVFCFDMDYLEIKNPVKIYSLHGK